MKPTVHIVISKENYEALKKRGSFGNSFNDVLTDLLKILEERNEK